MPELATSVVAPAVDRERRYAVADEYRAALSRRSLAERRQLAHLKRLLERYSGDERFRAALDGGAAEPRVLAAEWGIAIDPGAAKPLLEAIASRRPLGPADRDGPLVRLWREQVSDLDRLRAALVAAGDCPDANPRFHTWRRRQIARVKSELGGLSAHIPHSIFAFELSTGCSIGCWFCGVSAERLRGNFTYTQDNAQRWQSCLEQAIELFGDAVQTGFCYWATDPSDNPDYPRFIEDFYRVTGAVPQTTMAAPLRDLTLTRRVMALHDQVGSMPNRFSILNRKILDAVHATFTAEELLGVELVLQHREALTARSPAGRARYRPDRLERENGAGGVELDGATIACVSGFLVNMVEGRVRLISPTRTSDRWPLGYRVFGERNFGGAVTFRQALTALIDEHMPIAIGAGSLRFREDLVYRREPRGFVVESRGGRFGLSGSAAVGRLGDLLRDGRGSADDMAAALASEGLDLFVTADLLQQIFERGLLEPHPSSACRKRCRQAAGSMLRL